MSFSKYGIENHLNAAEHASQSPCAPVVRQWIVHAVVYSNSILATEYKLSITLPTEAISMIYAQCPNAATPKTPSPKMPPTMITLFPTES